MPRTHLHVPVRRLLGKYSKRKVHWSMLKFYSFLGLHSVLFVSVKFSVVCMAARIFFEKEDGGKLSSGTAAAHYYLLL